MTDNYFMEVWRIEPQTKACPFCAETIQQAAIKCRFCGEFLNTDKARALIEGDQTDCQAQNPQEGEGDEDNVLFWAKPSLFGITGPIIRAAVFIGILYFIGFTAWEPFAVKHLNIEVTQQRLDLFVKYKQLVCTGLMAVSGLVLLLKIVRLKMTYYEVTPVRIEHGRGILDRRVDNLDMFRVVDLKLRRSLLDCLLGIGSVTLITSDKSDPEFRFDKLRRCRKLYDIIKKASLKADQDQKVVHLET